MANSPVKNAPHLAQPTTSVTMQPSTPRNTRTIRRLQSAQALSSSFASSNTPSLTSQQRQQQQQQHRNNLNGHKEFGLLAQLNALAAKDHHRSRSNSDDALTSFSHLSPMLKKPAMAKKSTAPNSSVKSQLESLVKAGPKGDLVGNLDELRYLVLTDAVDADIDGMSALRIYIWLILLNAPPIASDAYLDLIHRGPSPAYSKIRNDTFRTLATDPLFKRRVSEASLIRLLNAVAWTLQDAKGPKIAEHGKITHIATGEGSPELRNISPVRSLAREYTASVTEGSESGGSESGIYVQGMNVLCAPFLYAARSEAEGFAAFHQFLTLECPGYVRGAMDGVHKGLALVDKCLAIVDPQLASYLLSKGMHAEIYAFPSVLTLCACTPPLPEVLHLWDFLFSYGAHLNILCIVAQLYMIRETIFASPSPTKILRSFPPLQGKDIRNLALAFVRRIPPAIWDDMINHAK